MPCASRLAEGWPPKAKRILQAYHLPDSVKFELVWEEQNLLSASSRELCFQFLMPGMIAVAVDNRVGRGVSKIMGWMPWTWVLRPIDKYLLTPVAKEAFKPAVGAMTGLPRSPVRDKDARAWREVLALAPAKITSIVARAIILDIGLDALSVGSASAGTDGSTFADSGTAAGADYGGTAASAHVWSGNADPTSAAFAAHGMDIAQSSHITAQLTHAFQPLLSVVHHAHAHSIPDRIQYGNDLVKAIRHCISDLPAPVKEVIEVTGSLSDLPWDEHVRPLVTFTAF
jgi:hypothetical protein